MIQEGNVQLFELELTKTQLKTLSSLLPKGFSFEPVSKQGGSINSGPTKKIFTNEKKPVTKKPAKSINNYSDNNNSIIKPAIREPHKRKVVAPIQYKPSDLEVPQPTPSQPVKNNNQTSRKCLNLLQKLKKHPAVGPFLFPVDVKGLGLYDYYDVVREPMDISTVEQKLKKGSYTTASQFAADVRKIWNNAIAYNMEGSEIYLMTLEMRAYFEGLYKEIDNVKGDAVRDLEKQVEFLTRQLQEIHSAGIVVNVPTVPVTSTSTLKANRAPSKPKAASSKNNNTKLSEKPLTVQERTTLVQNIKKLSPEHLRGVWDLVSQRLDPDGTNREELEFDVEYLPVDVARELEKYVKHKLSLMNRSKNRAKAREAKKVGDITNYKQQESYLEVTPKEDDITTQHHSVVDSDGGREENVKGEDLLSDSDGSSFISDSESEEDNVKGLGYKASREAIKGGLMGF